VTLVYFTDRDLGLRFPEILRNDGLTVERHQDHFRHDAADEVWLAEVGRRGWVALTHNSRIRYTPNEKEAVIRHGVRLLVIIGDAPYPDLARSFGPVQQTWRRIRRRLGGSSCGIPGLLGAREYFTVAGLFPSRHEETRTRLLTALPPFHRRVARC
jgi:PIN like domain